MVGVWLNLRKAPASLAGPVFAGLFRFDHCTVRLNQIKLSGFKSFADPTTFQLPGQLVGVVGPNGCGKSNIMDAVRWVLGESRASELRGETMQDVIFNGTTSRKAASRSSVELVFDNASHRAGGQWAQFAEIAVRRVLTRDGTSSYYINNQVVRRRDVQDVFLGTGLGPRAYAIIGQGTISRIIESKPEELRLFLEEAAGVSKYKERRRETENRLSDTRDNLTRVDDILRELGANLDKLEKQAEVAQKYNTLHAEATTKQQQLWFFRRADAMDQQSRAKVEADATVNLLQSRIADLRAVESVLETVRQSHYSAGDDVNKAQGLLYEASAEVGRLEAEIRFVVEGRQRVEQRLRQLAEQASLWEVRRQDALSILDGLGEQGADANDRLQVLEAQMEDHANAVPLLEAQLQEASAMTNEQRTQVVQVQQHIQVLAADQRNMGEQSRQLSLRRDRLSADQAGLVAPDEGKLQALGEQLAQAQASHQAANDALQMLQTRVPELDAERRSAQQHANQEAVKLSDFAARCDALKALQDRVKTDHKLKPWLTKHGLDTRVQLWSQIHIEPGWERALEAALRERLNGLEVSKLDMVRAFASDPPAAKLNFYALPVASVAPASGGLPRLVDLLRLNDAGQKALLEEWLHGCFTAPTLAAAFSLREQLHNGESIFVNAGHVVTRHSVSFYAQDSEQSGLLARAQDIENLQKQIKAHALIAEESRLNLAKAESSYAQASADLNRARAEAAGEQGRAHGLNVEVLRMSQMVNQVRVRGEQISADLSEIDAQLSDLQERKMAAEERFEQLDMQLGDQQERHARLQEQTMLLQNSLSTAREQMRSTERAAQEAQFAQRALGLRQQELQRSIETAVEQAKSIEADQTGAAQELARLTDASAQAGLQSALGLKLDREAALGSKRSQYDDLTAKLRASDERRLVFERELEPLRARITEFQLKEQAARLGFEQYEQFLVDAQADIQSLGDSIMSGQVKQHGLQTDIERLNREIVALGAVNLAALDELAQSRERKTFLDAQNADLLEAMTTLEDAIKKIDGETRELLAGTFNTVNGHFGKMFPELFGGGNARLVMTGEEILDSGVQVIAQPPGKKNQTIHLLSGGEKALTAIALVFAIFMLNPAPFCLLDEVDAPLDDANTERYSKLVKKMAAETQFLFISHNKIAMEMAEQLIGVTMQEQGVSRIVTVDMESATALVESA